MINWMHSHSDFHHNKKTVYLYCFFHGVKIWKRRTDERLNDKSVLTTTCYGFNPNGIIWFSNEEKFLNFI